MEPTTLPMSCTEGGVKRSNKLAIGCRARGCDKVVIKKTFIELEGDATPTSLPASYNSEASRQAETVPVPFAACEGTKSR